MTIQDSASPPRRFAFHGPIRIWDATERRLSLGGRDLWLAPGLSANELEVGTQIVAKGYEGFVLTRQRDLAAAPPSQG